MKKRISVNDINIGHAIRNALQERDLTVAWLARQINFDDSNLSKHLNRNHIYPELLFKISVALNTDFFAEYSKKIKQIARRNNIQFINSGNNYHNFR